MGQEFSSTACRHGTDDAAADLLICSACCHERRLADADRARMRLAVALLDDAWLDLGGGRPAVWADGLRVVEVRTGPTGRPAALLVRLP